MWLGEYEEDGVVYFRLGRSRSGDELVAEWPHIATLVANPTAKTSRFDAAPGADRELVDKVHRSLAQALLRHLDGKLTLHGSAVVMGDRAVAIVGGSGSGKSTLAAALSRIPNARFAADDTVALEFVRGGSGAAEGSEAIDLVPTETRSWLLPDSCRALGAPVAEDKHAVEPPALASRAARLQAIVLPTFGDQQEPTLARIQGTASLATLVPSVVRFVIDEPSVHLRELDQLTRLVAAVPIYALIRPRDLARHSESTALVASVLTGEPNS